jgi:hypothetical protein
MFYSSAPWSAMFRKFEKEIAQFFKKVAKTVSKPKNAKISTTMLNLKVQNILDKPHLKP